MLSSLTDVRLDILNGKLEEKLKSKAAVASMFVWCDIGINQRWKPVVNYFHITIFYNLNDGFNAFFKKGTAPFIKLIIILIYKMNVNCYEKYKIFINFAKIKKIS